MTPKAKKPKKLKESAIDQVFSKWVRNRDGRCVKCGTTENLQCAHVYSRTARSVRWYPDNAVTLCFKCHFYWAHKNPLEFADFIETRLGEKRFKKLIIEYANPKAWSQKEKRDIFTHYSSLLASR